MQDARVHSHGGPITGRYCVRGGHCGVPDGAGLRGPELLQRPPHLRPEARAGLEAGIARTITMLAAYADWGSTRNNWWED
eukprot:1193163-Prorocentrum_minimum.AAC.1